MSDNEYVFGFENVMIWPITATDATGKPTYGAGVAVPGEVEFKMDPQGAIEKRYAGNKVYFQIRSSEGYEGDLTIWNFTDELRVLMIGEKLDANGALYETDTDDVPEFAIGFQIEGDKKARRHLFYRCTGSRIGIAAKTMEGKPNPETQTMKLSAVSRKDTGIPKIKLNEGDEGYDTFYTGTPYEMVPVTTSP